MQTDPLLGLRVLTCTGTGLDWTGLDWTGLDWTGVGGVEVDLMEGEEGRTHADPVAW
jgi:hypothetical protein